MMNVEQTVSISIPIVDLSLVSCRSFLASHVLNNKKGKSVT